MDKRLSRTKKRSGILWQMTLIVAAMFIISSIVTLLFYIRSTNKMVESSKDKLVRTQAQDMASTFQFVTEQISGNMTAKYEQEQIKGSDIATAILNKEQMPFMTEASDMLKDFEKNNMLDTDLYIAALQAMPPYLKESLVLISNRDSLLYTEPPASVQAILDNEDHYGIIENGIPEWGLEGKQLAVFHSVSKELAQGAEIYAMGIRSLEDDLAEIDGFYSKEMRNVDIAMVVVLVLSLIVVVLVTFFVFRYLISSRITAPIDELATIAETVMEGDLDVEVPIKEGEEFENLKKAFNEMLWSIREVINKSSEGQD